MTGVKLNFQFYKAILVSFNHGQMNNIEKNYKRIVKLQYFRGAHGVMVIIGGNGHCDMSTNHGLDWLHFT